MSLMSIEQKAQLKHDVTAYDYVRFSWADLNGILRGKTIPARHAPGIINRGCEEFPGTYTYMYTQNVALNK